VQLGGVFAAVTETLLPGLCPHCEDILPGGDRGLCGRCWSTLIPLMGTACPRCGIPADDPVDPCLGCSPNPPPQQATVIWGEHDGALRTAIVMLKHRGRDDLAVPLGNRLAVAVACRSWADSIDAVCFVPSHPLRLLRRPWTASELIARAVARRLGRPLTNPLRRHGTNRQTGRSRASRLALPRRSFSASSRVAGRHLLLVDDVTTTGTTLERAVSALHRAGAESVSCAAVAIAPDPRRGP
jgi:predicted amidophosphoribosyltransferase